MARSARKSFKFKFFSPTSSLKIYQFYIRLISLKTSSTSTKKWAGVRDNTLVLILKIPHNLIPIIHIPCAAFNLMIRLSNFGPLPLSEIIWISSTTTSPISSSLFSSMREFTMPLARSIVDIYIVLRFLRCLGGIIPWLAAYSSTMKFKATANGENDLT